MLLDKLIFLGFEPEADFQLQDDGAGPYIAAWFSQRPQPQQAQLDAIDEAVAAQARNDKRSDDALSGLPLRAILFAVADRLGVDRGVLLAEAKAIYKNG